MMCVKPNKNTNQNTKFGYRKEGYFPGKATYLSEADSMDMFFVTSLIIHFALDVL